MGKQVEMESPATVEKSQKALIALKDWRIISGKWDKATNKNEFDLEIKAGDDVSKLKLPKPLIDALRTEKVI